ncbi:MAG: hypothetical protein NTW80_08760 [Deltaproteobacteria bacterium]|nr:hypothetical protein [Deltaproteobacteria bacterium]
MEQAGKGALLLVTALVLSVGLAGAVGAQPMKAGRGGALLTPEQTGKVFDLKEKLNVDTVDLRRQMAIRMAELNALGKAEKPETKAIQAKKKEIQDLRAKYQEKLTGFQQEVQKIAPEYGMGKGMGPGHPMPPGHEPTGSGPGMGPGPGPGMGAGPGGPPPPAKQPGETPPPAAPPAK